MIFVEDPDSEKLLKYNYKKTNKLIFGYEPDNEQLLKQNYRNHNNMKYGYLILTLNMTNLRIHLVKNNMKNCYLNMTLTMKSSLNVTIKKLQYEILITVNDPDN